LKRKYSRKSQITSVAGCEGGGGGGGYLLRWGTNHLVFTASGSTET
jgi:hypothetical protein